MEQNQIQLLPDLRQQIHDLIMSKHASGLSPPEEELVIIFEAEEYSEADQEDE